MEQSKFYKLIKKLKENKDGVSVIITKISVITESKLPPKATIVFNDGENEYKSEIEISGKSPDFKGMNSYVLG